MKQRSLHTAWISFARSEILKQKFNPLVIEILFMTGIVNSYAVFLSTKGDVLFGPKSKKRNASRLKTNVGSTGCKNKAKTGCQKVLQGCEHAECLIDFYH